MKCSVDRKRVIFVVVESGRESHANDAHAPTNVNARPTNKPPAADRPSNEPPPVARPSNVTARQTKEPPPAARPTNEPPAVPDKWTPTGGPPNAKCQRQQTRLLIVIYLFFIVKTMPPRNPTGIPSRINAPACWLLYFGQHSALIRPIGKGLFCFCGGWEVEPCQRCPVLPHPLGARAMLSKGKGGRSGSVPLV